MKILVDVDGPLAASHVEWLGLYNRDYDDNLRPEDIKSWDTHLYVKPECGKNIYNYLADHHLYDNVLPVDGAMSGVNWLKSHGHEVLFVSSGVQEAKAQWMEAYGFIDNWMFSPDLVISHHKYHINGDFIIDDNLKNCDEFGGRALLFNEPWNQDGISNHVRVYNWPDIIEYFTRN